MDRKINVLHVDDNSMFRQMIGSMLSDDVYYVDFAIDGSDAVSKVFHNQYDIILMDINMPVMDGHVSSKTIKKMISKLPIIALTLYEVDLTKYYYFDGALKKPIKQENLISMINAHII